MNTDSFYIMGQTHRVCQDYARTGVAGETPYILLADGCSSSPDTDIGARILTTSAESVIQVNPNGLFDADTAIEQSRLLLPSSLKPEILDATLLLGYLNNQKIETHVYGDGVIAGRRRDGSIKALVLEHSQNAPTYLNYRLDLLRKDAYLKTYGTENKVSIYDHNEYRGSYTTNKWLFQKWDIQEFDLVCLFSDGLLSFSKEGEPIQLMEVLPEFMKVPNFTGQFMTRRCQKFFKQATKLGWSWADDFSVAALWTGELE